MKQILLFFEKKKKFVHRAVEKNILAQAMGKKIILASQSHLFVRVKFGVKRIGQRNYKQKSTTERRGDGPGQEAGEGSE